MNPVLSETNRDAFSMAKAVLDCIKAERFDEAQTLLDQLHFAHPDTRDIPAMQVLLALKRGRTHDAWQTVNGLPDDSYPELKALCLKILGDPSWYGYAAEHEGSSNALVRRMMRQLLGKPSDT